jgi:pSer/pThr/pTyr-binding forkhead associated (FHA) protein
MEDMYPIKEGVTTIGRDSDNDIQLTSSNISRHHARITNLTSVCEIEDLNSSNGTLVNGDKVTAITLKHGNEITLADEVFRFEETASVGAEDVIVKGRDYSERVQRGTVKMKQHSTDEKITKPATAVFRPLRPKGA